MSIVSTDRNERISNNCSNIDYESNCSNIIRPVGLPPHRHCVSEHLNNREYEIKNHYAFYSSNNVVLSSKDFFTFQTAFDSGTDIGSDKKGNIILHNGTYMITYSFSGKTSERNKMFIVHPYINGNKMKAEGVSISAFEPGSNISGSNSFLTKITDKGLLYFKADGTQMLTGASLTVSIIKIG